MIAYGEVEYVAIIVLGVVRLDRFGDELVDGRRGRSHGAGRLFEDQRLSSRRDAAARHARGLRTAHKIEDPLTARGVVLLGAGKPIVLCTVDWIGIGNGGHDVSREGLARAVGTSVDRVTVHALHQHDGVRCDFTAEELLAPQGLAGKRFDVAFVRKTIADAAQAAKASLAKAQAVTHLGVGEARVEKVASNRRILGPDGRVAISRSSSYRIPEPILSRLAAEAKRQGYDLSASRTAEALAAPEGVIDPMLKMLTFFNEDQPLVSLSYYATHPQSYFGKGDVTAEFVGLARTQHEQARGGLTLVHFNGASGNVAAGKYNDGTPEARVALTGRMADGMQRAGRPRSAFR